MKKNKINIILFILIAIVIASTIIFLYLNIVTLPKVSGTIHATLLNPTTSNIKKLKDYQSARLWLSDNQEYERTNIIYNDDNDIYEIFGQPIRSLQFNVESNRYVGIVSLNNIVPDKDKGFHVNSNETVTDKIAILKEYYLEYDPYTKFQTEKILYESAQSATIANVCYDSALNIVYFEEFYKTQHSYYMYDVQKKEKTEIFDDPSAYSLISNHNGYIYYSKDSFDENTSLYKMSLRTKKEEKLLDHVIHRGNSSDGRYLFLKSDVKDENTEMRYCVYDVESNHIVSQDLSLSETPRISVLSPNGEYLLYSYSETETGSFDELVKILSIDTGKSKKLFTDIGKPFSVDDLYWSS